MGGMVPDDTASPGQAAGGHTAGADTHGHGQLKAVPDDEDEDATGDELNESCARATYGSFKAWFWKEVLLVDETADGGWLPHFTDAVPIFFLHVALLAGFVLGHFLGLEHAVLGRMPGLDCLALLHEIRSTHRKCSEPTEYAALDEHFASVHVGKKRGLYISGPSKTITSWPQNRRYT